MKKKLQSLLIAKDSKTKLAKSVFFGAFLALIVGFYTSEVSYYKYYEGRKIVKSQAVYKEMFIDNQLPYIKKTEYNSLIIVLTLLFGTALAYSVIKERQTQR